VAIMALRDEGRLCLDDELTTHVPDSAHAGVTIRQLLAHVSGMQREPVGNVWETLEFPDRAGLVAGWNDAQRVGRPHHLHHYSNLSYAMLGEVLCRVEGAATWFEVVQRRILQPLGMTSTTLGPVAAQGNRVAGAYFVPPWSDVPRPEPTFSDAAFGAAGALWSTPTDLARWGGFVADPVAEVLSPDTLDEMCEPLVMAHGEWELAWGLGLMLWRRGTQILVGHTGAYPGSITGVFTHRPSATTGLAWANNSAAVSPGVLAVDLATYAVQHEPAPLEVWVPGEAGPPAYEELIGPWFSEGDRSRSRCAKVGSRRGHRGSRSGWGPPSSRRSGRTGIAR
jgi:CubicO group peptidase (beta-lactamase class C family)